MTRGEKKFVLTSTALSGKLKGRKEVGTMRLKKLERDESFAIEVLKRAPFATLAMVGGDGRPYCVPVNTVWSGGALYFHCAGVGEKWEILKHEPYVCLTAVSHVSLMPEHYDTAYDCAMVKGRARVLADDAARDAAMRLMMAALAPEYTDRLDAHMAKRMSATMIVKIIPEEITGKQNVKK